MVVSSESDIKTVFVVEQARTASASRIRRGELRSGVTQNALPDILRWGDRMGGVPRSDIVTVPFIFDGWRLLEVGIRAVLAFWRSFAVWRGESSPDCEKPFTVLPPASEVRL